MQYAFTFGSKYNDDRLQHPSGLPIRGNSFIVVEADTEIDARIKVINLLGCNDWAFTYEYDDNFKQDVKLYDLKELVLDGS